MSDVNANPGAAPQPVSNTPASAGQPAQAQAPQIDPQQFETFKRHSEQLRGVEPTIRKLRDYGLADERALDSWGNTIKGLTQRGVTPQQLSVLFSEAGAGDAGSAREAVAMTEDEIGRRLSEVEKKAVRTIYERQHKESIDAELGEFSEDRLKKDLEGLPDEYVNLAKHAAVGLYTSKRSPYSPDHPLHESGQYGPAGRQGLDAIKAELKASYQTLQKKWEAEYLVKMGKAAQKPVNATVAGQSGTQGKPETQGRDWKESAREEAEAVIARRKAARAQAS